MAIIRHNLSPDRPTPRPLRRARYLGAARPHPDHGQATAEYALIILAAGGIALGVIAWASGTGSFTDMFEAVIDKLTAAL
jgi:Protein of unknown function (DUF4244)